MAFFGGTQNDVFFFFFFIGQPNCHCILGLYLSKTIGFHFEWLTMIIPLRLLKILFSNGESHMRDILRHCEKKRSFLFWGRKWKVRQGRLYWQFITIYSGQSLLRIALRIIVSPPKKKTKSFQCYLQLKEYWKKCAQQSSPLRSIFLTTKKMSSKWPSI